MYFFLWILLFGVFGMIGNALAADCIIVGDSAVYRIAECIENQTNLPAIQRFLDSNYAIITDRKDGKILAVFLAETNRPWRASPSASRKTDNADHQDQETAEQSPLPQPAEQYKSIEFPFPILLSSADRTLNDLRSQRVMPTQFMVSFGEYQVLYDLGEGDTIAGVMDREKHNLLDLLDRQKQAIIEQPSESAEKSLQMVEKGRNDLLNGDMVLKSVFVLQQ